MSTPLALLLALAVPAAAPTAAQDPAAGMLRYPDVSATHVVFVYANDLWVVPREGGDAQPLASPPGPERAPRFSPDGSQVAFMGNYDGDTDLYVVDVAGGLPRRVTHHPDTERLTDWAPDGRLVFSSSAESGQRRAPKVFTVSPEGGLPTELPLPYGANAVLNADGRTLAYTPNARDERNWKRYVGGMATDVWLFDLEARTSLRVTDWVGTDSLPMWHGDALYYLSDAGPEARLNLWRYDRASGERRQVTRFSAYDVKWPSIGPGGDGRGEIVFQNNSGLFLLDLATETTRELRVTVPGVLEAVRPSAVDVAPFVTRAAISPTGKRAVVEARGDVWTLPAEHGSPRNLTATSGVAERDPSWSPDGRWIAYFSDASGEYELTLTQSDGRGETRTLTQGSEGYRYGPTWAPDSEQIAFSDRSGTIHVHVLETGETYTVGTSEMDEWGVDVAWSHDGRWLAFADVGARSLQRSIHLFDTDARTLHQVTSDMFSDRSPAFDRKGDFLYFVSSRNFEGLEGSAIDSSYVHRNADVLLAVPLRADVEYPWAPKSDEETWADEDGGDTGDDAAVSDDAAEDEDGAAGDDAPSDAPADDGVSGTYSGSFDVPEMGRMQFSLDLTVAPDGTLSGTITSTMGDGTLTGRYDAEAGTASGELTTDEGEVLPFEGTLGGGSLAWTVTTPDGFDVVLQGDRAAADGEEDAGSDDEAAEVVEIDLEGFERRALLLPVAPGRFGDLAVNAKDQLLYVRGGDDGGIKLFDLHADERLEKDVTGGQGFALSADGEHILVRRGRQPAIGKAAAGSSPKNVSTDGMRAVIDPREEWPQLYREAWRLFRDYFYAANMHGVDWDAVYARYRPLIDACAVREDVDYVIRETMAELNCGHTYLNGGALEDAPQVGVGLLGCDFELDQGAYRIARIVEGGAWDADARGPLSQPGVDVHAGDYLLAVDGVPLDVTRDPWAAFVGRAGQAVELTVSAKPTLDDDARRVRVETLASDAELRYRAWIEHNRAYVAERSDGRVGYVYVPDTGINGRNDFFRQLYGQTHLDALIVDERWNGGGFLPTREIEALNRPLTNYFARRWARSMPVPADAHQGPKCMLINRDSGSGGDMFPYLFKHNGLGKLIGTRTWGGLVGYSGNPSLIDGATVAVPSFAFYELDGTWGVEGHGVDPDIEVLDDPAEMQDGADPQLDAAIALMLAELEEWPGADVPRPADPDRSGIGLAEEDRNSFAGARDR